MTNLLFHTKTFPGVLANCGVPLTFIAVGFMPSWAQTAPLRAL
jgi:hypothetical protein